MLVKCCLQRSPLTLDDFAFVLLGCGLESYVRQSEALGYLHGILQVPQTAESTESDYLHVLEEIGGHKSQIPTFSFSEVYYPPPSYLTFIVEFRCRYYHTVSITSAKVLLFLFYFFLNRLTGGGFVDL